MKYLILTEKPSARKNFEKALGGSKGGFADFEYEMANLRGHVMTLKEPEEMVDKNKAEFYKAWQLENFPWQPDTFSWQYTYIKSNNPRTGKKESTKPLLDALKKQSANGFDAIVIATDTDPSGEGELLAWEAILTIGWTGKVLRANFMDESEKSIKQALSNLRDVTDFTADGDFVKGTARNRWDFLSMQLTRIATIVARSNGYRVKVAREGRLKSAMLWHIFEQLQAIKHYVKKPFYEVRFKDENDHVYKRKADSLDDIDFRFKDLSSAEANLANYQNSPVGTVNTETKYQTPPKLLDLSSLSAILSKDGFEAKEVLATYQKMYEAQIVSYPRTEDKTITPEQFNELLPPVDHIAGLVGIDTRLLTHRQPRKTHVKEQGAHGANRPGSKIPKDLNDLSKYGPSAQAIYTTLAKNYLAMLGEDYEYQQINAELEKNPNFITSFTIPAKLNWKAIYQDDDEHNDDGNHKGIGQYGDPYIYEGANAKPTQPTWKWLKTFLEKYDIGTGATRTSTYAELSSGKDAYIEDKKGKIALTPIGEISAYLVKNTYIADPKITKRVFDLFHDVGVFKISEFQALQSIVTTIAHDMPIMIQNGQNMTNTLGEPEGDLKGLTSEEIEAVKQQRTTGEWQGKHITFKKEWGGHEFDDDEIYLLLAGEEISFEAFSKNGKPYTATGKLTTQTFKGKKFVGFKSNFKK
jgi:DNA topoisomerase-3